MDLLFEPLIRALARRMDEKKPTLLAIDGQCASGKTTLAAALSARFGASVFHMDDFFLPPEKRAPERLSQPGGNVEYERFEAEVLGPLRRGESFLYRPFSCRTGALGPGVTVKPGLFAVVEGAYARHPAFGAPYDLTACLLIEPEVQRERLLKREGDLARRFFDQWIPMENRYLSAFSIPETSDFTFTVSR